MAKIGEFQKHLKDVIVRGPFEFRLVKDDGLAVMRPSDYDAAECRYRGVGHDMFSAMVDVDAPAEDMAKHAEVHADELMVHYEFIHEAMKAWGKEQG